MATTRTRPAHGHRNPQSSGGSGNGRGAGNGGSGGRGPSRRPRKRRNPFLNFLRILFNTVIFLVLAAAVVVAAVFLEVSKTMPSSINGIENYTPLGHTLIYSADGALLADMYQQNRQLATIDKIPANLQNATVAIEDKRFWSNNAGFDIHGIGRALFKDVNGGDITAQGGSTITQQLVRNLGISGIDSKKTVIRKVREIIYANQIERNYSKQQILEMYLNEVYYGSGAWGVQAAAETYFGKPVDQLDLAQCALIAGIPRSPKYFSPYAHKQKAQSRRDTVLASMHELGYISDSQYEAAVNEPIVLAFPKPPSTGNHTFHAPYFVDYLVHYLTLKYGSDFINRGGIKVYTSLNWEMQQQAENIVSQQVAGLHWLNVSQGALVCMEPQTGYIKAMVGGTSYKDSQFNIAADGPRQPGSSFKPIYYTAALDSGIITENTRINDGPIELPGADGKMWRPTNDDNRYHGDPPAIRAIAMSYNLASVRVMQRVGVATAIRYARMMGVHSPLAPYITLALGASAVTPLEMADVYATIDNGGARPIPSPVMQITDDSGQIIEDDVPKLETTGISSDACAQMSDMLRAVVTDGTAAASFRDNNPPDAHGKTGTTQNHLDVWFDGYTKDLVTIVWAGHPDMNEHTHRATYGEPLAHAAWGATVTVPIWKSFMVSAEAIEQREKAREARLNPPKKAIVIPAGSAKTDANGDEIQPVDPSQENTYDGGDDDSDSQNGDQSTSVNPTITQQNDNSSSGDSAGTTPVWVDDDTGQPTTPNAPNSHQETFAKGYAPTAPLSDDAGTATPPAGQSDNTPAPPTPPTKAAQAAPKMVTVQVCTETGLRATKWCPETISETFVAGTEPKKYCNIHKPPPGE